MLDRMDRRDGKTDGKGFDSVFNAWITNRVSICEPRGISSCSD